MTQELENSRSENERWIGRIQRIKHEHAAELGDISAAMSNLGEADAIRIVSSASPLKPSASPLKPTASIPTAAAPTLPCVSAPPTPGRNSKSLRTRIVASDTIEVAGGAQIQWRMRLEQVCLPGISPSA